jgi:phosphonoacetaldehyde hydrolase
MEEGKNEGMWTIGLTRSGNMVGLDGEHWAQPLETTKEVQLTRARRILLEAGADYFVEDLAFCNPALAEIEERLKLSK